MRFTNAINTIAFSVAWRQPSGSCSNSGLGLANALLAFIHSRTAIFAGLVTAVHHNFAYHLRDFVF